MMPAAPKTFCRSLVVAVGLLAMTMLVPLANAVPVQLLSARNPSVPLPAGGDDNSVASSLSPDGRFVVFTSAANDLVPGGNNVYALNVFLRDRTGNTTLLVSGNLSGTGGGNGNSMSGQASTNGQFVVFQSDASNLVPNDTNGVTDIFVRDLVAGTTTLVSVSTNGGPANGASTDPVMTPDGRYVAFISSASNLVPGDTNGIPDVFVRDLVAGTNCLVSVGALLPSGSISPIMAAPVITPDGRYVAFFSLATNLVPAVPGTSTGEVYVRDRLTGTTTWASTNAAAIVSATLGLSGMPAYHPRLSDDGRYVAFKAGATTTTGAGVILQYDSTMAATAVINTNGIGGSVDLDDSYGPEMTPGGRFIAFARQEGSLSSGYSSVHVWDSQGAVDTLVSDNGSGVPTNTASYAPVLSPDGQFVAFLSNATNLVGNAVSNGSHVYLRNLQSSTTQLVDVDTNGIGSTADTLTSLSLSADGRYVAFSSPDGSLVNLDNNRAEDVFVRDLVAETTEMVSQRDATVIPQAADALSTLSPSSASADGRWVAFTSPADDLVPNDTNKEPDVFVRDLVNGTNLLVSVGSDGGPALGGGSGNAVISTNGRYVVFISAATNLVTSPTNANANVFRRDLQTDTTIMVSVVPPGFSCSGNAGNGDASDPVISPDGRYIAFLSQALTLGVGIIGDFTTGVNTYWWDMNLGQIVGLRGASYYSFGPSMSSNGRYVAYAYGVSTSTTRLQIRDTQLGTDIYTNAGAVTSAAIDPTGTKILYRIANTLYVDNIATRSNLFSIESTGTAPIRNAAGWSDDGRWLTFVSTTNLGSGDDGTNKVYLLDFQTGTLSLIGVAGPGTGSWDALSDAPVVNGGGQFVAYRSIVTNTVIGDNTAPPNVFLLNLLTGSNTVLTIGQAGYSPRLWVSRPVVSDGGTTVAFLDLGSGLVAGDLNRVQDAFGYWVDSDGDGIPDWWMIQYFGHPTGEASDLSLASDDADGSGMSNLQDYIAGTDPTNPNSVFRLSAAAPANSTISLTWPAVAGRSYQIQYKTNLDDPVWLTAPGNISVIGSQGYYLAPAAQSHSFYRVLVSISN
jgi:Tol biopolymer transport system component